MCQFIVEIHCNSGAIISSHMKIHFALAVVMIWQATKALHRPLTYNDFMREDSIAHINERFAHDAGKPHAVRTVRTYSTCMTASNIGLAAERDTMKTKTIGPSLGLITNQRLLTSKFPLQSLSI